MSKDTDRTKDLMAEHGRRQRPLAEALARQVVADSQEANPGSDFEARLLTVQVDDQLYHVQVTRYREKRGSGRTERGRHPAGDESA